MRVAAVAIQIRSSRFLSAGVYVRLFTTLIVRALLSNCSARLVSSASQAVQLHLANDVRAWSVHNEPYISIAGASDCPWYQKMLASEREASRDVIRRRTLRQ